MLRDRPPGCRCCFFIYIQYTPTRSPDLLYQLLLWCVCTLYRRWLRSHYMLRMLGPCDTMTVRESLALKRSSYGSTRAPLTPGPRTTALSVSGVVGVGVCAIADVEDRASHRCEGIYVHTQDGESLCYTGSKHMGLWRGHVGCVWLVCFVGCVCIIPYVHTIGDVKIRGDPTMSLRELTTENCR